MALYDRRKSSATKKRLASARGRRTSVAKKTTRRKSPKKPVSIKVRAERTRAAKAKAAPRKKVRKRAVVAKPTVKKRAVAAKPTVKKRAKSKTVKRPAQKRPKPEIVKKRRKPLALPKLKRPVAKRKPKALPKPKKRAITTRKTPRKRTKLSKSKPKTITRRAKRPARAALAREKKRLEARLAKIVEAEQAARGTSRRGPRKKAVREAKKETAEERIEQAFAHHQLPHGTTKERSQSREDNWERMRKRFRELLEYAKKHRQTPPKTREPWRVDSREIVGQQRNVRIDRIVSHDAVEDILYKVDHAANTIRGPERPLWLAKLVYSNLGEKILGSGPVVLAKAGDPDAFFFHVQEFDSTGAWNTYRGMMEALRTELERYADEPRNIVYMFAIKVMNFDRK